MFARLGRWSFLNRRLVVLVWVLILASTGTAALVVGNAYSAEFDIPDSESADGLETVQEFFPGLGGARGGSIVFQSDGGMDQPEIQTIMEEFFDEVAEIEGTSVVSPYSEFGAQQVSPNGKIAFAQVNFGPHVDPSRTAEIGAEIEELKPEVRDLSIEVGGRALAEFEPPQSELIGLAFAIIVLMLAFGSVMAMGLPIGVALFGVGTGAAVVGLLSNVASIPDFAPVLGAMIGLGVGIDYALLIVTRYRAEVREGLSPEEATVRALDTAGRAVVFAGIAVVVSLLGMLLMGLAFISGLGIAAATTVTFTMLASMTLLPALIGFAQERIEVTRWGGLLAAGLVALGLFGAGVGIKPLLFAFPLAGLTMLAGVFVGPLKARVPDRKVKPMHETVPYKWSRLVQAHPWLGLSAGAAVLLALSAPLVGIDLGFSDEGNYGEETTTRRAYDMVADGFGPGFNSPFLVAVEVESADDFPSVVALSEALAADPGVQFAAPPFPSDTSNPAGSAAYLIRVIPTTSPQDAVTSNTVERLRQEVIPPLIDGTTIEANVTGIVPTSIDFTNFLSDRLPIFLGVVLAMSFVLLMAVFRSLLVPVKAVVMNMLSISAAYGVVVAIFQWGWFGGLTGIEPAPIEPFIPMMMFAIIFGLSMDYEVFLLSRVKEEYDRTGDPRSSVADGLAATAHVITAAAAIMVVVFGSFLFEDTRILKVFGTGLATAIFLDATLVRMLLVPSTMELLGTKNWWLPAWIDRLLPTINVEGPTED